MARRRRMSAKQRRFFGGGRVRRYARAARRSYKRYSRGFSSRGWLPLSGREMVTDFVVGGTAPLVSGWIAPYTDGILSPLGNYKDEARTAIIGAVIAKLGGGMLHEYGKETFRLAVMSAGAQTASNLNVGAMAGPQAGFALG